MPRRRILFWIVAMLCIAREISAAEHRDRQWFVDYVRQPIADSPRNQTYLAKIDQAALKDLLDIEWLDRGDDGGKAREQATLIGHLAFAYHTKGTRWHRDPDLLTQIRAGFRGFAKRLTTEGRFVWPTAAHPYEHQAHEHVWRLEPLLLAYIWVEQDLTKDERREWLAMLKQAGEYLLTHPLTEANNRGAVWCAGTMLCGLFFDDRRYLDLAARHAPAIMDGLLARQGQVVETQGGGGPDANYTYVGWAYAYFYRLLSGDKTLDERLISATRWLVCYASFAGDILASGSATRKPDEHAGIAAVLPTLERYASTEPFFANVADRYLAMIGSGGFGAGGVTVNSLVWALLEKRGGEPINSMPHWFRDHTEIYEWPSVHYLLACRPHYQTGISFRANFPLRGLQAFAWENEPAIVQHTGRDLRVRSFGLADGIDTSRDNVAKGPSGWEIDLRQGPAPPAWKGVHPTTAATRQKTLWTYYAFTPSSLVVVYGGSSGAIEATWAMNHVPEPKLDAEHRTISTTGRQGRIHFLRGEAALVKHEDVPMLRIKTTAGPNVIGLSDDQFRFGKFDDVTQLLEYSDVSGSYRMSLREMVDANGNLVRENVPRLEVLTAE